MIHDLLREILGHLYEPCNLTRNTICAAACVNKQFNAVIEQIHSEFKSYTVIGDAFIVIYRGLPSWAHGNIYSMRVYPAIRLLKCTVRFNSLIRQERLFVDDKTAAVHIADRIDSDRFTASVIGKIYSIDDSIKYEIRMHGRSSYLFPTMRYKLINDNLPLPYHPILESITTLEGVFEHFRINPVGSSDPKIHACLIHRHTFLTQMSQLCTDVGIFQALQTFLDAMKEAITTN